MRGAVVLVSAPFAGGARCTRRPSGFDCWRLPQAGISVSLSIFVNITQRDQIQSAQHAGEGPSVAYHDPMHPTRIFAHAASLDTDHHREPRKFGGPCWQRLGPATAAESESLLQCELLSGLDAGTS